MLLGTGLNGYRGVNVSGFQNGPSDEVCLILLALLIYISHFDGNNKAKIFFFNLFI